MDAEERNFEKTVLALKMQLDKTEREYLNLNQLLQIVKE